MIDAVCRMLAKCGEHGAPLPPTELYNEGWMLRLVLDWFAAHKLLSCARTNCRRAMGVRGTSALQIPTVATRRSACGRFTHADGVVGHFEVRPGRGDILLRSGAQQLLVIEAKLGSALSAGIRRAPDFDQAARDVACVAHIGQHVPQLGLFVLAPRAQIASGVFGELVTRASISAKVRARCAAYGGAHDIWLTESFGRVLDRIQLALLSWEEVLDRLAGDSEIRASRDFYSRCFEYNPPRVEGGALSVPA